MVLSILINLLLAAFVLVCLFGFFDVCFFLAFFFSFRLMHSPFLWKHNHSTFELPCKAFSARVSRSTSEWVVLSNTGLRWAWRKLLAPLAVNSDYRTVTHSLWSLVKRYLLLRHSTCVKRRFIDLLFPQPFPSQFLVPQLQKVCVLSHCALCTAFSWQGHTANSSWMKNLIFFYVQLLSLLCKQEWQICPFQDAFLSSNIFD